MPARIIETNDSPLQPIDVDGITVDLIENALKNAREEMDALVSRTALSPGIREQGDCFPMIANRDCLLYTSPSPRDQRGARMPSSA